MTVKTLPSLECLDTFHMSGPREESFNPINAVAISPDHTQIAVVGDRQRQGKKSHQPWNFSVWDLSTGQERDLSKEVGYQTHNADINIVQFSANGKFLILGSRDPYFNHFEPKRTCPSLSFWALDALPNHSTQEPEEGYILAIAPHPTETQFASINARGTIRLWYDPLQTGSFQELKGWESQPDLRYPRPPFTIAYSANGRWLSSAGTTMIQIWDAVTGELHQSFKQSDSGVKVLAFSPNSQYLISGGDQRIRIWNLETGQLQQSFFAHPDWIRGVVVTPDSQYLISAGDFKIKLWSLKTGQLLGTLAQHNAPFRAIALSSDGQRLVTGSKDGEVKVWQLSF